MKTVYILTIHTIHLNYISDSSCFSLSAGRRSRLGIALSPHLWVHCLVFWGTALSVFWSLKQPDAHETQCSAAYYLLVLRVCEDIYRPPALAPTPSTSCEHTRPASAIHDIISGGTPSLVVSNERIETDHHHPAPLPCAGHRYNNTDYVVSHVRFPSIVGRRYLRPDFGGCSLLLELVDSVLFECIFCVLCGCTHSLLTPVSAGRCRPLGHARACVRPTSLEPTRWYICCVLSARRVAAGSTRT